MPEYLVSPNQPEGDTVTAKSPADAARSYFKEHPEATHAWVHLGHKPPSHYIVERNFRFVRNHKKEETQ